jgi:hypothetical protein
VRAWRYVPDASSRSTPPACARSPGS